MCGAKHDGALEMLPRADKLSEREQSAAQRAMGQQWYHRVRNVLGLFKQKTCDFQCAIMLGPHPEVPRETVDSLLQNLFLRVCSLLAEFLRPLERVPRVVSAE